MTTHDDLHDVETRLRTMLRERADDVDTTPALYERVQRQATRGQWLRRGLVLAGAATAVAVAVAVVPSLLPDTTPFDVVESPQDTVPSDAPTASEDTDAAVDTGDEATDPFQERRLATASTMAGGRGLLLLPDRSVELDETIVTLAATNPAGSGVVAAALQDGRIAVVERDSGLQVADETVDARTNGGVVPSPLGDAIAWIEGTDLHVLPAMDGAAVRVLPLEGDVPDDLRIEQWFSQADAQVILASRPDGGLWSIPMDDSSVFDTAPTTPAFVLAEDAVDGAVLDDLTRVELVRQGGAWALRVGDALQPVPSNLEVMQFPMLTTDGERVVVFDPADGEGALFELRDGTLEATFVWTDPSLVAVAPLPVRLGGGEDVVEGGAEELGLPTGAPVVATDGVLLVLRFADGRIERREVYPANESEAILGDLAVRPGSTVDDLDTADDGLVAVESTSEGETSIRFVRLEDGTADPVGDVLVTDGPVTGLVWSEDGDAVAWTDASGLHVATVGDRGEVVDSGLVDDETRPVVDWTWTDDDGTRTSGQIAIRVDGNGTQFLEVDRFRNGEFVVTGLGGGGDRLFLDTHAAPGAAVGPGVDASISDEGTVRLSWGADGDQFGDLPGPVDVGAGPRVEVSGGQVIVAGSDAAVLVTFDGEVVDLPALLHWDVVD